MSHTVSVRNIQCTNEAALEAACGQLGLSIGKHDTHTLFSGSPVEGRAVQLPGWRLPVVLNTKTGEAKFDNYGGQWGREIELDRLMQRYAMESTRMEALAHGYTVNEENLADGAVKMSLCNYATA